MKTASKTKAIFLRRRTPRTGAGSGSNALTDVRVRLLLAGLAMLAACGDESRAAPFIEFVIVGDPGNSSDSNGSGSVGYTYAIGKYEVTNTQYVTFLNAKATSDPSGLYHPGMTSDEEGGIIQDGTSGAFTYRVKAGYENMPVCYVSFFDAMRFTNWLSNGERNGDTETGSYTLALGGLAPRAADARFWIPSRDEWYKAAYYQPESTGGDSDNYWLYPTRSNEPPRSRPGNSTDANSANFYRDDRIDNGYDGGLAVTNSRFGIDGQNYLTAVGSYALAHTYYGTFDQGGNLLEWNEAVVGSERIASGGNWTQSIGLLPSSQRGSPLDPASEWGVTGFRIASVPETLPPILRIVSANNITITWEGAIGWTLQVSEDLRNWSDIGGEITEATPPYTQTPTSSPRFFRLHKD